MSLEESKERKQFNTEGKEFGGEEKTKTHTQHRRLGHPQISEEPKSTGRSACVTGLK